MDGENFYLFFSLILFLVYIFKRVQNDMYIRNQENRYQVNFLIFFLL